MVHFSFAPPFYLSPLSFQLLWRPSAPVFKPLYSASLSGALQAEYRRSIGGVYAGERRLKVEEAIEGEEAARPHGDPPHRPMHRRHPGMNCGLLCRMAGTGVALLRWIPRHNSQPPRHGEPEARACVGRGEAICL